jgi:hypothetical protein
MVTFQYTIITIQHSFLCLSSYCKGIVVARVICLQKVVVVVVVVVVLYIVSCGLHMCIHHVCAMAHNLSLFGVCALQRYRIMEHSHGFELVREQQLATISAVML